MTDPQPDPLFDALREQLADYGQEPPAHLWAGIRQQLPPPMALPQRRRRRAVSVALLALLLAVIGVVGWQAWELNPLRQPTVASHPAGRPAPVAAATSAFPTSPAMPDATPAAASATTASGAEAFTGAAGITPADSKAPSSTATAPPATAASPLAHAGTMPGPAGTTATTAGPSQPALAPAVVGPATAAHMSALAAGGTHHLASPAKPGKVSASHTSATLAATTQAGAGARSTQSGRSQPVVASAAAFTRPAPQVARYSSAADAQTAAGAGAALPATAYLSVDSANQPAPMLSASATTAATVAALRYDALPLRQPELALPPMPGPADPATLPLRRSAPPRQPAVRWQAYTLAGPALTGIRQGTAPALAYNAPATVQELVKEQEQSTRSGSLQLGLRCNLDAHWSLSAGLGVADYATQSTLSRRDIGNTNSSLDPLAQRDTYVQVTQYRKSYQFFSLPVRLGYAWHPTGRWQLGLLAGPDVMFLNRANEIRSIPLQTSTPVGTVTADRYWSLGGSLGLEARYHLSPRCELLAQPTFTYLLTSINSPRDGVTPRHPWSAALLLGVAYDLR